MGLIAFIMTLNASASSVAPSESSDWDNNEEWNNNDEWINE